jgi:hypothetical protein
MGTAVVTFASSSLSRQLEEFLLEVDGRLVRIIIEDARGADGTIPTLVCRAARFAQILPHIPAPPDGGWPGMPRGMAVQSSEMEDLERGPGVIQLDVSALPAGELAFALEDFAREAEQAVGAGVTHVTLDTDTASAWGCELVGA